jgi:hypothetical protein
MALMANGIVSGQMAWPLVIVVLAVALILVKAPSPMLIAVGMYLPFESTAAMFMGGLFRFALDRLLDRRKASSEERLRAENVGTLLSSGLIAGESLTAVSLAFVVLGGDFFPTVAAMREAFSAITPSYSRPLDHPVLAYLFVWLPLKRMKDAGLTTVRTSWNRYTPAPELEEPLRHRGRGRSQRIDRRVLPRPGGFRPWSSSGAPSSAAARSPRDRPGCRLDDIVSRACSGPK